MRRIVIVGNSGTGKTTLAARLADSLGLTHIELDALFHQADWEPTPAHEFRQKLRSAMAEADHATNGWTMCGNYRDASDGIGQDAADTIVWLDMPRALVMRRVIWRTVRRAITREELWNGNREPMSNFTRWDPEKNVIRWAWVKYPDYRSKFLTAMANGTWSHADVYRLGSPAEVDRFSAEATRAG